MWEAIAALIIAAIQKGIEAERQSEADKAAAQAQAVAALAALKGQAAQVAADHEARTAETLREIADAEKAKG